MRHDMIEQAAEFSRKRQRRRRRRKLVTCLGAAVVFCTTYALILPAITMESGYICGMAEHEHDETCFAVVEHEQLSAALTCQPEAHVHTDVCFDEHGRVICGLSDRLLHRHDADCYFDGELICTLPEVTEHIHSEACFQQTQELTCTSEEEGHEHGEECYAVTSTLICPLEQIAVHDHTAACYGEDGTLTCGILSAAEHQHSEDCLTVTDDGVLTEQLLICDIQEHTHHETCLPDEEPTPDTQLAAEPLPLEEPTNSAPEPEPNAAETPPPDWLCGQEAHEHDGSCYSETGALVCGLDAHVHTEECLTGTGPTEDMRRAAEETFAEEIEVLAGAEEWTDEVRAAADELLEQLALAHRQSLLSDAAYQTLYQRVQTLLPAAQPLDPNEPVAEVAVGTNWMWLRDSGWFEEYSAYALEDTVSTFSNDGIAPQAVYDNVTELIDGETAKANDTSASGQNQVDSYGGMNSSSDGVSVSKTIAGTELENVFDITLQVQTPQKNVEIVHDPDMAVVIVMDISATMRDNFDGISRYGAAMDAAETFLDEFADSNTAGISKIGYVAFNTDAHQIFALQECSTTDKANSLKNTMRTQTGKIINADGYKVAHNRFTNIEAGLKMAQDMLNEASNKNKFIVFLSDGFPTTYIENGYNGYDPYDSTGRFYDHVLNLPCSSGTSYSDEAAIRARKMASSIKSSGIQIFSIGVDVGGQTIQKYIDTSVSLKTISVVDRTGTTYEIGDASSTEAYKAWLKDSIGSGYYYDSTNASGLMSAYQDIFKTIKETVMVGSKPDWVATDPLPPVSSNQNIKDLEFIGMYDKDGVLLGDELEGTYAVGGENTAAFNESKFDISWDLKNSGYILETTTDFTGAQINVITYELKYRVRLKNEAEGFVEDTTYKTNGTTTLQYRVVEKRDNSVLISDTKELEFPIPAVHGYLGELTFTKQDCFGHPLAGAQFSLAHDAKCSVCRGNKEQKDATQTWVELTEMVATSDGSGRVGFTGIPSGHSYTLTETVIPAGYADNGNHYTVTVAYDKVTVEVTDYKYDVIPNGWDYAAPLIVNNTSYELPETGGAGTHWMYAAGLLLMAAALLLIVPKKRGKGESVPL